MTRYPELFSALAAPFAPDEVKSRQGQGGKSLHYITGRTVQNRLDQVLGPEDWRPEFTETKEGLKCRLSIRLPDGEWTFKEDGGGFAGMSDEDDNEKSGFSSAFKRAAVQWGIGRYLYRDGVASFVADRQMEAHNSNPGAPAATSPAARVSPPPERPSRQHHDAPRSGKGLFAWTKEQEQKHDVALLKYLNGWAKLQEFPPRMIDWDDEQVALGHAEALRKLESLGGSQATAEHESQDPDARPAPASAAAPANGQSPARSPLQTPGTDKANGFAADAQRKKLGVLVRAIARVRYATAQPTDEQFWEVVAGIDRVVPGGRIINIKQCDEVERLAEYIAIAEEQLAIAGA